MKRIKLGALALSFGLFAACGSAETTDDSAMDMDTTLYHTPEVQDVPVDTMGLTDTMNTPMTEPVQ